MKFGKRLKQQIEETLPEWQDKFLSYKDLKKLVRLISSRLAAEGHFLRCLDAEIDKFNSFFVEKEEDFIIRQKLLKERIQIAVDGGEMGRIQKDIVNFHGEMVLLENYSSINYTVCRKACLDTFGEHVVHCKELPGFKYMHDLVRNVLFDVLRHARISAKKETPVNFLTDPQEGRSTLRPADVLVYGWIGGRHACVDLTGVSPLVGLGSENFIVGQAALRAASAKVAKHEKTCIDNQHVFILFAFDTFDFLAPDAVELLKRVQRVMHSNIMTPRLVDLVFKMIGFAIQKGVAAQLVVRIPFISV